MEYITLKEAADLSGYSPDYIGQLIRKGKLPGKQVYCNVAWMTTKEAVLDYQKNSESKTEKKSAFKFVKDIKDIDLENIDQKKLAGIIKVLLYILLGISAILAAFIFYVFSVNIDRSLQQSAIQKVQNSQAK